MTTRTMARQEVIRLRDKLGEFLEGLSESLGYKVTLGKCKYRETANFELIVSPIDEETGEAYNEEAEQFKRFAVFYGLDPEDLGRSFRGYSGHLLTIVGANPRNRRYPILATREDGRRMKISAESVKTLLEIEKAKQKNTSRAGDKARDGRRQPAKTNTRR